MKEFRVLLLGLEQEKDVDGVKLAFIRSFFGDKKHLSKIVDVDGSQVKLDVVHPSGPFKLVIDVEIQNAHGFVICYSVSDINTLIEAVFIGERILRVLDADEAPMVLVGLPSNNPSVITKDSIALVTSKLRCEFITLTSFVGVENVFLSTVRAIKRKLSAQMEHLSQEDLDAQLYVAIKQNSSLNDVVTLLDMGASPEAKNKKGIGVLDIALSRWDETSKKPDLWREGISLTLYGRGAKPVKYKSKEPLLEELMAERTRQTLTQFAGEGQATLELVHSCITDFPEKILQWKWLTRLVLSNNRISSIPPDIDKLVNLRELGLDRNQLSSLPITVGYLSELRKLNLSRNFIRELPHTLGLLEKLEVLQLAENPLKHPPSEIIKGGTTSVLSFLKKHTPGAEKVWQAKACFLGPRGSGKTSLKHALLSGKGTKSLAKKGNFIFPTQGLEITEGEWELPVPDVPNKNLTLDCYDFSGQEVFFSHHHHFLTTRSIFLVCFNMLEPVTKVEFWLKFLRYKLGNVPIILVATHLDQKTKMNTASLAELDKIPSLYPHLAGFCSVSCMTGSNMEELKSILQSVIPQIPTLNERIPMTYLEFGAALKRTRNTKPVLDWHEFSVISKRFQINSESGLQQAVSKLQQLGILLYFPLYDMVVISPVWLSYILSSISKFTVEEGILMHNTLQSAWKDVAFDQQYYYMEILAKFEVVHSLGPEYKDNGLGGTVPISRSFIPALVPHIPPKNLGQLFPGPPKHVRKHVYKFIPCGLFQHLIINLLKWIDYEVAWQYGVVLTSRTGDVNALILLAHNQPPHTSASAKRSVPITPSSNPVTPTTPSSLVSGVSNLSLSTTPPAFALTPSPSQDDKSRDRDRIGEKDTVDFLEVRVDGDPDEAARVFRGLNETIEMLCQKRYRLDLLEIVNPCSHCINNGFDDPTNFSMKDCEMLAATDNPVVDCIRRPLVPPSPPTPARSMDDQPKEESEGSSVPFFRTHLRRKSGNNSNTSNQSASYSVLPTFNIDAADPDHPTAESSPESPHIGEPKRSTSAFALSPMPRRASEDKSHEGPGRDDGAGETEPGSMGPPTGPPKRFQTFRHSKSQFEMVVNPQPVEDPHHAGPEHQMVIAGKSVAAGMSYKPGSRLSVDGTDPKVAQELVAAGISPRGDHSQADEDLLDVKVTTSSLKKANSSKQLKNEVLESPDKKKNGKSEEKKEKRPLRISWRKNKKKDEPEESQPVNVPPPSLSVVIPNSSTASPVILTPTSPPDNYLDSPSDILTVKVRSQTSHDLTSTLGDDHAAHGLHSHVSPASSPKVVRKGHSPTTTAWSKHNSAEQPIPGSKKALNIQNTKTSKQGFFWSSDSLLQHKLTFSDFCHPSPPYTYINTSPYSPSERPAAAADGATPLSAAHRKNSRHKLIGEKSQSSLVKVPSDPSLRQLVTEQSASVLSASVAITPVAVETVAPDATLSDLDRDVHVPYETLRFEQSETHVIALEDYHNEAHGFSKGQVIEIKTKKTVDPKDKKEYYTGTFVDPHGKVVEIRFPANVVHKELAPIARGSYSEIKKCNFKDELVVAKVMDFSNLPLDASWNAFRKEIWIMSSISHQNLVSLKAYTVLPPSLVMEYLPHGDLYSYINKRNADGSLVHRLDFKLVLKLAMDIAQGMCYLHNQSPPIIHRDFKSPNILLDAKSQTDVVAKIADFGLSVPMYSSALQAEKARERTVVNPCWLAPEILREEQYSLSSDVYPFGIILWELLVQKHPFIEGLEHTAFISVLEDAIKEGDRPPIPVDCPANYAALIKNCWHGTPNCRPTFPEIAYQLSRLMTENDVPYPFLLGHMKVKNLVLMGKDKVQSLLVMDDLQQVWAGTRSGDIIIYSSGVQLGKILEHKQKAHPSVVKFLLRQGNVVYSISKEHVTHWTTGVEGTVAKGTFGIHPSKSLIISGATITTNNQMWCSYHDMSLVCWDLKTRQSIVCVEALYRSTTKQHLQGVFTDGCVLDAGDLLWVSSDMKLLIVDRMSCDVLFIGEAHGKRINALLMVEGRVWSGGNDGKLCIWDTPSREQIGKQQQQVLLHKAGYRVPQATREQKLNITTVEEFSLAWKPTITLEKHFGPVHCLMHTNNQVWSAGHDKNIYVWDYKPEIKLNRKIHANHEARISTMVVAGRERALWAGSFDSTISVWV